MNNLLTDKRVKHLLSRVGNDLGQLKEDVATLLSHTTHRTIPEGARELVHHAKARIDAGGEYAASRLSQFRKSPHPTRTEVVGGLLALAVIGAGICYLLSCNGCEDESDMDEN